jgi:hypothetical protein
MVLLDEVVVLIQADSVKFPDPKLRLVPFPELTYVLVPLKFPPFPILPCVQYGTVPVNVPEFPLPEVSFTLVPVPSSKSHLPTGEAQEVVSPGTQYSAEAELEATDPPVKPDVSDKEPRTIEDPLL